MAKKGYIVQYWYWDCDEKLKGYRPTFAEMICSTEADTKVNVASAKTMGITFVKKVDGKTGHRIWIPPHNIFKIVTIGGYHA
jgi:hypothetical protein